MENCYQCHYTKDYENIKCNKCYNGFYSNSEGQCKKCHYPVDIPNGFCKVCSDDLSDFDTGYCFCNKYYTLINHSTCTACPENCPYCKYNQSNGKIECLRCKEGYTINLDKTCTYCGDGCEYCFLDDNLKPICSYCFSGSLIDEKTCLICPDNCKKCKLDNNNEIICTECNNNFGLNENYICESCPSKSRACYYKKDINKFACTNCFYSWQILGPDELCYDCNEIPDNGPGCASCIYNLEKEKYECKRCWLDNDPDSYKGLHNYAYIQNTHQCLINTDSNNYYLYGCDYGNYIQENIYECVKCKEGFISVINDKTCKNLGELNLSKDSEVLEIIGDKENPKYSCYSCKFDAKVKNLEGIVDCKDRTNNLVYCLEATEEYNGEIKCIKCVDNSHIQSNICKCNSDSFGFNNFCYKCDDNSFGMKGCLSSYECEFSISNNNIKCNKCKEGYIKLLDQCHPCSEYINNCKSCHLDINSEKTICDNCFEGFNLIIEDNKCEYSLCEEHIEVMPGCYICDNKLEEYKANNKCQYCSSEFFKTKDESCIYCHSEKYGGPSCKECGYNIDENGNETEEIICKNCDINNSALNSKGQCYDCEYDFIYGCSKCEFKNDINDNTEKLVCTKCKNGYYLISDGYCYNILSYLERVPNCLIFSYYIENILFYYNNIFSINENYYGFNYYKEQDRYISSDFFSFKIENPKIECIQCQNGYFKNDEGDCEILTDEKCSLKSIIENYSQKYRQCNAYFSKTNYSSIDYIIENENNEENGDNKNMKINLEYIYKKYNESNQEIDSLDENLKSLIFKSKFYISNSGKGGDNEPKSLRRCKKGEYIQNNDTYICTECQDGFSLDYETNICKQEIKFETGINNCYYENIGTDSSPIYSCVQCYDSTYILITAENGAKYCTEPINELENCLEADVDTTYIDSIYNCTSCSINYIPYYNKFFGKKICHNIYQDIIREKSISLIEFESEDKVPAKNGECESGKLFTPDGINCYECSNKNIGIPGCKGSCTFSLKRNDTLKCEEGACKTGYIEKSKGICESCDTINKGCAECHYENEYPSNYLGFKRKRRFVCDLCEEDFIQSPDGKCVHCSELGFPNCEKCKHDNENDEFICSKCSEGYFLTDDGYCKNCKYPQIIGNNKNCVLCDDINEGGIEGCYECEKKNGNCICQYCKNGYILLKNNNTCIKINENNQLGKFSNCAQLSLDNKNKIYCSKCKVSYYFIKENNEYNCIFTHSYNDYFADSFKQFSYGNYLALYPCQEIITFGTEDKSITSCIKCYENLNQLNINYNKYYDDFFNYDLYKIDEVDYSYIKILESKTNISFCIFSFSLPQLENCIEAIRIYEKGNESYNCTKCADNNILTYNADLNINYCVYLNNQNKCLVQYCKTCQNNNNYFCNTCLSSNYIVNSLTGSCMKKTEVIPAITWKDIFRLQINSVKIINNKPIYGPSLKLRGITNSQINNRHSFLVYLSFKIRQTRNYRSLEEIKKVPTICEIMDNVDETNDDVNIVNYDCIGNSTSDNNLNDYVLNSIEEGNNEGLLKNSNLEELASTFDLTNLKKDSSFTLKNLLKIATFEMDEIKNQTSENYSFDISITGKLNREMEPTTFDTKIGLAEIDKKADCKFTIEQDKNANLQCQVNINEYKSYKTFSFKATDITNNDNSIYLSKIDEIVLFNNANDEDEEEKKSNKKIIIIISVIVSVIVLATIIVLIVYFCKKKKSKKQIDNPTDIKPIKYNGEISKDNYIKESK